MEARGEGVKGRTGMDEMRGRGIAKRERVRDTQGRYIARTDSGDTSPNFEEPCHKENTPVGQSLRHCPMP